MIGDWFDDDDVTPTSSYQMGTLCIYRAPKRPKPKVPVYGFKFVNTERTMKKSKNGKGKKKC